MKSISRKTRPVSLAGDYFRACADAQRLRDMLVETVVGLVGVVSGHDVNLIPGTQEVCVYVGNRSLAVTPEAQGKIYGLGFKRISVLDIDGWVHYYYDGGDTRGYEERK